MSIQSDIEMLSIQIMESYAARNNLLPREVNDKFHKHQIFEKIILQHEYLHQISFEEVMEFIKENRSQGGLQHSYDVVVGPVADDNTMETVQLYIAGILTADEAVERLKYSKANNQVSFHTERSLQYIKLVGRAVYE